MAETVNVMAEAPLVDVYKTDSSTNIMPEQIESLPVANRDFQSLAFLAPGVQRERGGNRFIGNQPVIGAAGNASQSTIMVDGVDFTDPTLGLARARFSQDAISEFRVIANRFDTEIGGSAGGALSIVTKSGTNDLHGSAFGFFRDKSLRAKGELDLQKNDYSRQQFGGTIGGPIVKDRTHFFGSFEQVSENNFALFRPRRRLRVAGGGHQGARSTSRCFYGGARPPDQRRRRTSACKFVYERYRQENFRVGGVADETTGMQLDRDNYNFTRHARLDAQQLLAQPAGGPGRPAQVRRAEQQPRRWPSTSRAATRSQTGANIVGDQIDTGNDLRGPRHLLHADRQRQVGAGPEVRRRLAVRHGRLELPGLPEGPADLRDRHAGAPAALRRHDRARASRRSRRT